MSDEFEEIKAGLDAALAFAKGYKRQGQKRRVVIDEPDVKLLRSKLGLSQQEFASAFGVALGTLRHWEQGLRRPEGPARVLLHVIERRPDAVADVFRGVPKKPARRAPAKSARRAKVRDNKSPRVRRA